MKDYTKLDQYLEAHVDESIAELSRLCAQPSVSAQKLGVKECAELVGSMLAKRGFKVEVIPTEGSPVVVAERKGRSSKTLLFYNHYDVQPAEPLDLWETPPFQPTIRDGKLVARGVSDDKGHIASRLFAIDSILANEGELPCNIKFVIEGEEETSSLHFKDFVANHTDRLKADACIWEGGGVDFREVPTQVLGMRGICYVELSVETANQDIHSGLGGSIFPNAAWRLVWALNTLKDSNEHIRIPGFYDPIRKVTPRERELFEAMPEVAEEYHKNFGIKTFLHGLKDGVELRIAETFIPTCTICGLSSGYEGPGSKTVLPCKATAKVDFRLVPFQTPEQVLEQLRAHLDKEGFSDIKITFLGGESPAVSDPDDPFVQMVVQSAKEIYGQPQQIIPMIGGSGPNYVVQKYLNIPIADAGVGHSGSLAHAPNENLRLDHYVPGCKHIIRIIEQFGDLP